MAESPGFTVADVPDPGAGTSATTAPAPESPIVCGLFGALSEMVSVPLRVPAAVGVNVTLIVQLAFTATSAGKLPQVFVSAKSPLVAMLVI